MADTEWNPELYLREIRIEIPCFDDFQNAVAGATLAVEARSVLELGVGTGETARRVRALHQRAAWTGIDASEAMLARAREALPDADLRLSRLEDPLPSGPFDLVVSALAVHHLDASGKRDLFHRVAEALRPQGWFVLGDVVVPERPEDAQIEIDWVVDLPDSAADQLAWLSEAGFGAELVWSYRDLAVIQATKSPWRPAAASAGATSASSLVEHQLATRDPAVPSRRARCRSEHRPKAMQRRRTGRAQVLGR